MPTSFKLFGLGFLVFLVGAYLSQQELRLMIWGKPAKAMLTDAWETKTRRSSKIQLQFEFTDEKGASHRGAKSVSKDWTPPADMKVDIVYLPSDPELYKLASSSALGSFLTLLVGVALMGGGAWYFNRESVVEAHAETAASLERAHKKTIQGRLGL